MASVRFRDRKAGRFWFVVDRFGHERAKGPGREGEKAARRAEARLERAEWAERRGELDETPGILSTWSLGVLKEKDLELYAARNSYPSRKRLWKVLLNGLGEKTPLHVLSPAKIQTWALEYGKTASPRTVNNALSLLGTALQYARRMRDASGFVSNPMAEVERLPVPAGARRIAKPEKEVFAIFEKAWREAKAAPNDWLAEAWRDSATIIELIYLTSSRPSQIYRLRWDQLDGELLRFPPHKGGAPREFRLEGRIAKLLARTPRRGEYVFPPTKAARLPYRTDIKKFWAKVAPAGFTPHGLRHSAITAALYAHEAPGDVVDRGGWKDYQMLTRTYGHVFRRPLGPTPRAGLKTAAHAGRERRSNAGQGGKIPHQPKASKGRQTRKNGHSRVSARG